MQTMQTPIHTQPVLESEKRAVLTVHILNMYCMNAARISGGRVELSSNPGMVVFWQMVEIGHSP